MRPVESKIEVLEEGFGPLPSRTAILEWAMIFVLTAALIFTLIHTAHSALQLDPIATGIDRPVGIVHANDSSGRLFIVSQAGVIHIFDGVRLRAAPFLNINNLVSCCGERGLLGLAFHPDYSANGFFYVNYTNLRGNTVIARYTVSQNPNAADPLSRRVILRISQPFANHNGGQLQFGPDGFLYIGTGDGGSRGDPGNRAQSPGSLLGKILRIDVDRGNPYEIPADNPFVGRPGARGEIWALGLRNPWRFSFDRRTGQMFIADVGQNTWEEINLQSASSQGGENYGWRIMEGRHCFNPATGCVRTGLKRPILEYSHAEGCSVTGGYRYRGSLIPTLSGTYIYGDFCSGVIHGARFVPGSGWTSAILHSSGMRITSFGEDQAGELYVADLTTGSVHRIAAVIP